MSGSFFRNFYDTNHKKQRTKYALASIESHKDPQEYIENIWNGIEADNPVILQFSLDQLSGFDSNEEQNGFLTGMSFCYEIIRRQYEAADLESM